MVTYGLNDRSRMRGSRPVLGGAEGEIPLVYSAHVNEGVF
jgi:hypothetical protein